MSEYKRWISYIYSYENEEKKNNIGFARIEIRDKKVKITVHINVLSVNESMDVYLYMHNGSKVKGYNIGQIKQKNGACDGSYMLSAESVLGSKYGINDMNGLIIYHSDSKFFASAWDDNPVTVSGLKEDEKTAKSIESVKENIQESVQEYEALVEAVVELESEMSQPDSPPENNVQFDEQINADTEQEEIAAVLEASVIKEPEGIRERIIKSAEKMKHMYPRMYPFEDDEMEWCVRIEPQDIGQLPIDTWVIANNSFLLHGYYSYRHLMLMKTLCREHPCYLIGVPGVYHNKDEFMAKMFGFEVFKAMSCKEDVKGEFGYWCISILDKI